MSRNPDYQFFDMDVTEIASALTADYEARTGTIVRAASVERLIIQWLANILLHERELTNYSANQNLPSRAEGANLEALAEMFFAQRRTPAMPASCTVRFHISTTRTTATLIPAGTRVTDATQSLYWETLEDGYVSAGSRYVDLKVQCQIAGTDGNGWAAGRINAAVDVYDYYDHCENITESDGGADEQTDDELYEAMISSMMAPSTAGSRGGYAYYAKSTSTQIADVAVTSPAPGEVRLYALMKDGTVAGETMKQAIYETCNADDARPLADHLEMGDPTIIPYTINLTYWIPSGTRDSASIEAAVRAAVEKYVEWQGGKLGRDLNPSVLIGYIMQTGVKRVNVESPVFTPVSDGSDAAPPAVALIQDASTDITLTNGGMENE